LTEEAQRARKNFKMAQESNAKLPVATIKKLEDAIKLEREWLERQVLREQRRKRLVADE
jgi:hypothetical protein